MVRLETTISKNSRNVGRIMIQSTSQEAYDKIIDKLGHRQMQVFHALQFIEPACNKKIASYLEMPINEITPRVNELRYKGVVKLAYKGEYDGHKAIHWRTVEPRIEKILKENPIQETLIDVPKERRSWAI